MRLKDRSLLRTSVFSILPMKIQSRDSSNLMRLIVPTSQIRGGDDVVLSNGQRERPTINYEEIIDPLSEYLNEV